MSDESGKIVSGYISLHQDGSNVFCQEVVGPLQDGEVVSAKDWSKVSSVFMETLKPKLEMVLKHLKAEIEPRIREMSEDASVAAVGNHSRVYHPSAEDGVDK
jgi:hypothetical protein